MGAKTTANVGEPSPTLGDLDPLVGDGVETSALLEGVAVEAARIVDADSAELLLVDDGHQRLVLSATRGLTDAQTEQLTFQPGVGVAGWVAERSAPAIIADATADARFIPIWSPAKPVRSVVAVPIRSGSRTIGVLSASHEQLGWFNESHRDRLLRLAEEAAPALEAARRYRLALTDPLTGLHNRQHFAERLREEVDRAHRYGPALSVLLLDLDRFAGINDAYGHRIGDAVLAAVGHRLQAALRDVDIIARYAGQAFAALLPSTNRIGAERAADRMLEVVRTGAVDTEIGPLALTASVGGAVLGPREEARDLLVRADAALYQAKSQGRDRAVFNWLCFASVS